MGALVAFAVMPARRAHADPVPVAARRAVPDYAGRQPPGPPPGEALLWPPRVVLFPLYLATEYLVRAPLAWLVSNFERHRVVARVAPFLHPVADLTIAPTLVFDLGLASSGGIYFAWDHALHPRNQLRVHASTGGLGYWRLSLVDRVAFAPRSHVGVRGEYYERSDWRFYGIGSTTQERDLQFFNWTRADAGVFVDSALWHHLGTELALGFRADRFGTPALRLRAPTAAPGYEDKSTWYGRARVFLDSRPSDQPNTSGVRLEGAAQFSGDLVRPSRRRWLTYELEAAVFIEIKRPGRVLGLRAYTAFADSFTREPVPFVDQVALGGFENMRGWFVGRFWGESAAVFTASYRYPVWYWLDGNVVLEAGNVFDRHLEGFSVARLHGSAGLGFRTTGGRDASFDILFAVGTSRFDEPFRVDSFRLALGLNRGF